MNAPSFGHILPFRAILGIMKFPSEPAEAADSGLARISDWVYIYIYIYMYTPLSLCIYIYIYVCVHVASLAPQPQRQSSAARV